MIQSEHFLKALADTGFGLISGVPCSYLTPLINGSINSSTMRYVNAANEGEAVAIAAGASLGGLGGVAMFQNSGLGNAVSPLTSLTWLFRIPILLITTWRGEPDGPGDEPQHELMGRITRDQLALMEVPVRDFPRTDADIDRTLADARRHMEEHGRPFALVMSKGSVADEPLLTLERPPRPAGTVTPAESPVAMDPDDVMRAVHGALDPADIVIAST
ncbi:MAG: phosphonopyruvate decarboxylase, partial [Acidimicrobiia bacterium]|nr:phosphonopyruvate decarboxylase [Acidimicrobiia bacterium]